MCQSTFLTHAGSALPRDDVFRFNSHIFKSFEVFSSHILSTVDWWHGKVTSFNTGLWPMFPFSYFFPACMDLRAIYVETSFIHVIFKSNIIKAKILVLVQSMICLRYLIFLDILQLFAVLLGLFHRVFFYCI